MRNGLILLLLLTVPALQAQEDRRSLRGKVTSDTFRLDGIYIINRVTEKASETRTGGYFEIEARAGDTLMFTSTRFKGRQVVVKDADFDSELLFVALESMIQLDEVV